MLGPSRKDRRRGATPLTDAPRRTAETTAPAKRKAENTLVVSRGEGGQTLRYHRLALAAAVSRLARTPLASFFTLLVIAIALALPTGMEVMIKNVKLMSGKLGDSAQISLFLHMDTPQGHAQRLAERLRARADVRKVDYIAPEQALAEFEKLSGFSLSLASLDENPLPGVLVVYPVSDDNSTGRIEALLGELRALPEVDMAQLDLEWVQRLYGVINLATQIALALSVFLIIAVALIIGNTIRLMSQSYRDEIEVSKLVGATDAYVRRPFLYTGALLGFFGALLAGGFVFAVGLWIDPSVQYLAQLYQSDFKLLALGLGDLLILCLGGLALGLIGAWLAVGRFLRQMAI